MPVPQLSLRSARARWGIAGLVLLVAVVMTLVSSEPSPNEIGSTSGAPQPMRDMAVSKSLIAQEANPGMAAAPEMMPIPADAGFTPTNDRTIVKNASLTLQAADVRATVDRITALTKERGGVVTLTQINEPPKGALTQSASMTLRLPAETVEESLKILGSAGERVLSENFSADDRTEQRVDLEAQLNNLRTTEAQFQTIMAQAKTVTETLEVQRELSRVRGEIERTEAYLQNLQGDARMATVNVEIRSRESDLPIVEQTETSLWDEVKLAARNMIRFWRNVAVFILQIGLIAAPVLAFYGLYWLVNRRSR